MKIYLVVFDWATDDESCVDIDAFDTYEKAVNRFNEIIQLEKDSRYSWVADAFDENDEIVHGYEFDYLEPNAKQETECYWNITNKNDWYMHDFLSIQIKEVK